MIRFFIVLLALATTTVVLIEIAYRNQILIRPTFLYQTSIFLVFATGVIYRYLYRISKPETFVQLYLFMMAVKLAGYGVYVFFMITSDRANATANVVYFMTLYFMLTFLEIAFLYRKINQR